MLYLVSEKFANIDLHPEVVSNTQMGTVFEELIRKFAELSNETAGEQMSPREVIRLIEFNSRVENGAISIPTEFGLVDGREIRVLILTKEPNGDLIPDTKEDITLWAMTAGSSHDQADVLNKTDVLPESMEACGQTWREKEPRLDRSIYKSRR